MRASSATHSRSRSGGHPGSYLRRRRDVVVLFGSEHVQSIALEGKSSRQRLVEHDPQVVPVAGRRDRAGGRLFRRHVGQSAQQVILRALVQSALSNSAARPKSKSTTRPSAVTSTFRGLMSRCSFPASCNAAIPSASCAATRAAGLPGSSLRDPTSGRSCGNRFPPRIPS